MKGLLHKTETGWYIQYIKRLITDDSTEAVRCSNIPVLRKNDDEVFLDSNENNLIEFEIQSFPFNNSFKDYGRINKIDLLSTVLDSPHAGVSKKGTGPGVDLKRNREVAYTEDDINKARLTGELYALLRLSVKHESKIAHQGKWMNILDYVDLKTEEAKKLGWL